MHSEREIKYYLECFFERKAHMLFRGVILLGEGVGLDRLSLG